MRWSAGCLVLGLLLCSSLVQAEDVLISTGEYPPWTGEKLPDGGVINRIVREAFRREGQTVRFHFMPWPRAIAELKTGEVQASSYWGHDPARDGYTLMSDTLLNGTWRLFHLRGTVLPRWNRLADLSRYRFGTTRSYTYPDELDRLIRNGTLKVVVASDDESTMVNLLQGTVDIVPIDELTGEAVLMSPVFTQQALNSIVFDDKPFSASPGYLLVRKTREGTRLVHLFNMGLASMKADGTLKRYEREMFKSMTDEAQVNLRP